MIVLYPLLCCSEHQPLVRHPRSSIRMLATAGASVKRPRSGRCLRRRRAWTGLYGRAANVDSRPGNKCYEWTGGKPSRNSSISSSPSLDSTPLLQQSIDNPAYSGNTAPSSHLQHSAPDSRTGASKYATLIVRKEPDVKVTILQHGTPHASPSRASVQQPRSTFDDRSSASQPGKPAIYNAQASSQDPPVSQPLTSTSPPKRSPAHRPEHSDSDTDKSDKMADSGAGDAVDKSVTDRAVATKELLEARLKQRKADMAERRQRRMELNAILADPTLNEEAKKRAQAEFEARERDMLRESRKRLAPSDFDSLVVIGRGAFGEVKLVRFRDDGRIYAMKTMHKSQMILKNQRGHVQAERDALAAAENPWIVNLHYSFQDAERLYLVMDFCAGGDLMTLLIKEDVLPEGWVKFYAAEAIMALATVHAMGYIHRDIKPDNMLLDHRGHLRLTDLGLCKKVDDDLHLPSDLPDDCVHEVGEAAAAVVTAETSAVPSHHDRPAHFVRDRKLAYSTVGTPDYIDYQVLLKKGYSYEADWWALGTVLYECMLGFPPFYGEDPVQTCRKILHYKTTLKFPADRIKHLSPEAVDFLKCLITDADKRLGTKGGLAEIKAHPWFKGFDWDHLAEANAPWVPPNGKIIGGLLDKLASLPREDPQFDVYLKQLTANFDDFSNLPADDPRHGFPGGHGPADDATGKTVGKRFQNKFVGFTFKRGSDGRPALAGPASGSMDGKGAGATK